MYKSFLWRVAECLSYMLDAWCLKVKNTLTLRKQCVGASYCWKKAVFNKRP